MSSFAVPAFYWHLPHRVGFKFRNEKVFPSINKPGLGEKHTKQIHTSLSDKMLTDNFSNTEELIDTLFSLRKSKTHGREEECRAQIGNLKLSKNVSV